MQIRRQNMQKKLLPFQPSSYLSTWSSHAHLGSIISSHNDFSNWVNSNYIQMHIQKGFTGVNILTYSLFVDLYNHCKLIKVQRLQKQLVKRFKEDIVDFFKECIEMENYIYISLDIRNIQSYSNFNNTVVSHDPIIIGYDDLKQSFIVADFFDLKYEILEISYKEISEAYNNLDSNFDFVKGLYLLQLDKNSKYSFDITAVMTSFEEYLYSKNTISLLGYDDPNNVYGLKIYDFLSEFFLRDQIDFIDLRQVHFIEEHKISMLKRIQYMLDHEYIKNNYIINEFITNQGMATKIKLLFLKFKFKKGDTNKEKNKKLLSNDEEY